MLASCDRATFIVVAMVMAMKLLRVRFTWETHKFYALTSTEMQGKLDRIPSRSVIVGETDSSAGKRKISLQVHHADHSHYL